jgi:uncharacterized protein (DUF433 family)
MPQLTRITRDPSVMGGKACIRDMRVTVGTIVGLVAASRSHDEILADYPYLEAEDIAEALSYAAWRAQEIEVQLCQPSPDGGKLWQLFKTGRRVRLANLLQRWL